jgi:predicted transcriptional regulator
MSNLKKRPKPMSDKKDDLVEKWGEGSLGMGFTAIPTTLLFLQKQLGITPLGMNILLNLISHWWDVSEHPYPAQDALAARMGVSKRSIQREIASLVELGLIKKSSSAARHPKYKGRNAYDLAPLVKSINEYTPSLIASMKQRRSEAANKKPA